MQNYRNNNAYRQNNSTRMPMRPVPTTPCYNTQDDALEGMPIAMAYVPWQNWQQIYDLEQGFCRGTIFKELDKPFLGKGGSRQ